MCKTLDHNLAEAEAKKQGNRVRDVKPQAFCDPLTERLAEVMVGKVGETLPNLKAASTVLTLFPTLAVMKPANGQRSWPHLYRPGKWSKRYHTR